MEWATLIFGALTALFTGMTVIYMRATFRKTYDPDPAVSCAIEQVEHAPDYRFIVQIYNLGDLPLTVNWPVIERPASAKIIYDAEPRHLDPGSQATIDFVVKFYEAKRGLVDCRIRIDARRYDRTVFNKSLIVRRNINVSARSAND